MKKGKRENGIRFDYITSSLTGYYFLKKPVAFTKMIYIEGPQDPQALN